MCEARGTGRQPTSDGDVRHTRRGRAERVLVAHAAVLALAGIATHSEHAVATDRQAPLTIVAEGQTDYVIAIPAEALPATRLAARELRTFVERSTDVRLRVVSPIHLGHKAIILWPEPSLPFDSFSIRASDSDLIIAGNDGEGDPTRIDFERPVSCGTLYGVYHFLETVLGVRFYWPDELGTVVPRLKTVQAELNSRIEQHPYFSLRRLRYGPGFRNNFDEAASRMWGRRLRLGTSSPVRFYHAWRQILDVEEWARRGHPEYAALVNGKRQTHYDDRSDRIAGQVCTSNPEVQRIFVDAVRTSSDRMVSISPNDGHSCFCECEDCRALDSGRRIPPGPWSGRRDLSDRIITFYNLIAERSGRRVGGYAYKEYIAVPAHTRLHPNVTISIPVNNACRSGDPDEVRFAERIYRSWGQYSPRASAYDILYRPRSMTRAMRELIAPLGADADRRVRLIAESGLAGAQLYIAPEMELGGPDAYVVARLLWDPDADSNAIRTAYYHDLYGNGARHVQRIYELCEARWRYAVGHLSTKKWRSAMIDLTPQLRELVDAARKDVGDDAVVLARLARLRNTVDVMTRASRNPDGQP